MTISLLLSLFSLLVSIISVFFSYKNNQRFASNQFINKQIDVITDLLKMLHSQAALIEFLPNLGPNGYFAYTQHSTLFEIPTSDPSMMEGMGDMDDAVILFDGFSNQLLPCKEYIDNPFLPKSIADTLLNFHTARITDYLKTELAGQKIILFRTDILEAGLIGSSSNKHPSEVCKGSDGFAFRNWTNLCQCIGNLVKAIVDYLKRYKVKEINIRKDKKHLYLS